MVKMMIDEDTRKALKNTKIISDSEIDAINKILMKDHNTLYDLVKDIESLGDNRLRMIAYHIVGNTDYFSFFDVLAMLFKK